MNGVAHRPLTEPTNRTRPVASRSSGSTACVTATCATTFTSSCRRRSSTGTASSGPETTMPALLTTASSLGPSDAGQRRDLCGLGDVEDDRAHRAAGRPDVRRGAQGVAVLRAPDAGVDLPAAPGEAQRDDAPDAATGAGDEDRGAQDAAARRA